MYCSRCGTKVDDNSAFCNKCGLNLKSNNNLMPCSNLPPIQNNKKNIIIGIVCGIGIVAVVLILGTTFGYFKYDYYFSDDGYISDDDTESSSNINNNSSKNNSKGKSIIVADNSYDGVSIVGKSDAYALIVDDSVSQKSNCPKEILSVENDIIEKYGITAVNLCEMDVDFAKEIQKVFDVIYNEYPSARGYITNLSLYNTSLVKNNGIIAAFMPIFQFATSNSTSTYPWVIKTQILLNSSFFLNPDRLQSSVNDGSASGHFPPNATKYSPVAHELGHYLSFLAMLKDYKLNSILLIDTNNIYTVEKVCNDFAKGDFSLKMLKEAYNNYQRDKNSSLSFDEWRGTISKYALAKDNNGEYIYDETIAEAFHDVYLNKNNAKDASKYIISVLKQRLGR